MPIGLAIDGANRNDFKMMKATLESIPVKRPRPTRNKPQGLCLDKGYDYDEARPGQGVLVHGAHPGPRRGSPGDQARGRLQGPPLGGGANAQLDEPLPPHLDAVGEEARELPGAAASGLCRHHVPLCRVIRIGSKTEGRAATNFMPPVFPHP